ncbi:MAG: antitoxin [Bacteroidetes bacterium]|nr:antitoxin [Bacteroidota bacterium]
MSTLQVRDIDEKLYDYLKVRAKGNKRSLSQEVITILEELLNSPHGKSVNSTIEFLSLSGSWEDSRPAEEIAEDIRSSRTANSRLGHNNGLFD